MAKGGGGEGHFDERRRAAAAKPKPTYKADSPEVIAAIEKPRAKPVVVVKKKPKLMPMAPPRKLAQAIPGLRMGARQAEARVGDLSRKQDLGPFDDQIVTSSLKRDRSYGDIVNRDVKTSKGGPLYSNVAGKGGREDQSFLGYLGDLTGWRWRV